jgi:hypothetical protein
LILDDLAVAGTPDAGIVPRPAENQDEREGRGHAIDNDQRRDEAHEAAPGPPLHVLRMIAQPRDVAAAEQVRQLEERLMGDGEQKMPPAQEAEALQDPTWIVEVLERFGRDHQIEALAA